MYSQLGVSSACILFEVICPLERNKFTVVFTLTEESGDGELPRMLVGV